MIDETVFNHLVKLAALELDEKESQYLRRELNNQLMAIQELEAIPIEKGSKITSHGISFTPQISMPIREDVWIPDLHPEEILNQAPEIEDGYIVVPDIPHEELE